MREFINTMKGLSDPSRVKIIKLLQGRELCACHITQVLGLAQSTTSKHLKTLLAAGLVACTKEGLNRDLEAGAILEGGWLEEFKKRPGSPRQSETASSEKSAQAVDTEVCYGIPFQEIAF